MPKHSKRATLNPADQELPGDIMVTGRDYTDSGSATEAYHRYQLLKEKVRDQMHVDAGDSDLPSWVTQLSEREHLEILLNERLAPISESSAEFSQLADLTGTTDKYEMARVLAEIQYNKLRADLLVQTYGLDKDTMQTHFVNRNAASLSVRTRWLSNVPVKSAAHSATSGSRLGAEGEAA